ncbi:hypothetical protein DPEC_G00051640 [Dallia pectoralis]|uniref:Uncharacterized protein n=1 Tax=Dallia pectoralis TaxID=75939 RepID=A0ACC2HCR4_DALPE|nr:hypothetical protein DPEC_G00051640 [Dallia pectoralis]
MLSSISETLIFFFLGVVTITTEHEWNWGYIGFTLLFAFLWRGLGVLVLAQIINPFRTIPFNFKDQFLLGYSGLRGAVAFALVFTLPDHIGQNKPFVSATICLILFTVFIQGISIRPLVEFINVRRTNRNLNTINVEVNSRLMEHAVAGIEDLCGQWGHFYWKDKFMKFNNQILRKILIKDNRAESSIVALYKKLELHNAMEILDIVSGDTSTTPSVISIHMDKKGSGKPKKKFVFADLKNMHDILSKNMYKTRQQTTEYTTKHSLPNDNRVKEILIRRHSSIRLSLGQASSHGPREHTAPERSVDENRNPKNRIQSLSHREVDYPSARRSRIGQPSRSSSRASLPLRRLDTLTEVSTISGLDLVDERSTGRGRREGRGRAGGRGRSHHNSFSNDTQVPVPPFDIDSSGGLATRSSEFHGNSDPMLEQEEPLSPSVTWATEPRDHDDNSTQNPLLRRPQRNPVKRESRSRTAV